MVCFRQIIVNTLYKGDKTTITTTAFSSSSSVE